VAPQYQNCAKRKFKQLIAPLAKPLFQDMVFHLMHPPYAQALQAARKTLATEIAAAHYS
jgi:hypothetical protein